VCFRPTTIRLAIGGGAKSFVVFATPDLFDSLLSGVLHWPVATGLFPETRLYFFAIASDKESVVIWPDFLGELPPRVAQIFDINEY
jgi:hypothetical protein